MRAALALVAAFAAGVGLYALAGRTAVLVAVGVLAYIAATELGGAFLRRRRARRRAARRGGYLHR